MSGKSQFVVRYGDEWAVRAANSKKITKHFDKQSDAIAKGQQIAINQQSELLIQGKHGQFRSKDSYGRDPNPPKDIEQ